MSKSRAWQAAVNGVVALGGNLGTIALGLACTPFIVAALGLHAYGLWALYGSITVYFTLTDFGLGATFVKSIAEYHELGYAQRVRQVVTFGVLLYLALGAIVVPLVALAAPWIDSLFKIAPSLASVAPRLLVAIAIYAALSNAFNVFGQALIGFQLMRKSSVAGFWGTATFYASALTLLYRGFGIDALIVATFLRLAVQTAQTYYQARRAFGPLFCNPLHIEWTVIRPQFKMGAWIQVMNVCSAINNEAGRFVVGAFVSIADVSYFDVAMRLTRQARALPMNFSNALLPGMSALDAAGSGDRLASIYALATRYFMFATALLMGGIAACAFPLMTVWMGRGFEPAAGVAMLLAAAFFVSNLSIVGSTLLLAVGKPQYEASYGIVNAITNISASLLLVHRYGLYGVAGGMLAGTVAGQIYFTWILHRTQRIALGDGLLSWLWKLVIASGAGVGADLWLSRNLPIAPHVYRLQGLAYLGLLGVVYLAVFAALTFALRFFSADDLARMRTVLHVARRRSTRPMASEPLTTP